MASGLVPQRGQADEGAAEREKIRRGVGGYHHWDVATEAKGDGLLQSGGAGYQLHEAGFQGLVEGVLVHLFLVGIRGWQGLVVIGDVVVALAEPGQLGEESSLQRLGHLRGELVGLAADDGHDVVGFFCYGFKRCIVERI